MTFNGLDDAGSVSSASGSISSSTKKARRLSKSKTTYNICYPPPGAKKRKKDVRLQLHKVERASKRAPAFNVVPLATISSLVPRNVSKPFFVTNQLGLDDYALVDAESYIQNSGVTADQNKLSELPAVICNPHKDGATDAIKSKGRILLSDGSKWTAIALTNGSYEFIGTHADGTTTTMRWVLKRPNARFSAGSHASIPKVGLLPSARSSDSDAYTQFNFSIISQYSRRHPVVAHLTSQTLEVHDSYTIPAACPSVVATSSTSKAPVPARGECVATTPALRLLIKATAVWIVLRENWAPGGQQQQGVSPSAAPSRPTTPPARVVREPAPAPVKGKKPAEAPAKKSGRKRKALARLWRKIFRK